MNVNDELLKLLDVYKVDRDFTNEIREGYRNPLEDVLNSNYDLKPNYRYGGSLAKGTANTNSCDIDLLCYFDSNYNKSLENIYDETQKTLSSNKYLIECKNSAITVTGKIDEEKWDTSVDVVPGKYTSNEDNKDVYLWCNKDKKRLKSNPEIQIEKVKQSKSKDVIRILKLYRSFNNFKFKSFYLEIFAIDVVENDYEESDNLYDKLIKFCSHYKEIGITKIYDPANKDNNINTIHDSNEFEIIREKIRTLYDVLQTNDSNTIINCIKGETFDIENGYLTNAKSHSTNLQIKDNSIPFNLVSLNGYWSKDGESNWTKFNSEYLLKKNISLRFEISIRPKVRIKEVKLIVSNAGYEAMIHNSLRGNAEETYYDNQSNKNVYCRTEETSYYGNHFVQAFVLTKEGKQLYSNLLVVKIR